MPGLCGVEGIAKAKAAGVYKGRKPKIDPSEVRPAEGGRAGRIGDCEGSGSERRAADKNADVSNFDQLLFCGQITVDIMTPEPTGARRGFGRVDVEQRSATEIVVLNIIWIIVIGFHVGYKLL